TFAFDFRLQVFEVRVDGMVRAHAITGPPGAQLRYLRHAGMRLDALSAEDNDAPAAYDQLRHQIADGLLLQQVQSAEVPADIVQTAQRWKTWDGMVGQVAAAL